MRRNDDAMKNNAGIKANIQLNGINKLEAKTIFHCSPLIAGS